MVEFWWETMMERTFGMSWWMTHCTVRGTRVAVGDGKECSTTHFVRYRGCYCKHFGCYCNFCICQVQYCKENKYCKCYCNSDANNIANDSMLLNKRHLRGCHCKFPFLKSLELILHISCDAWWSSRHHVITNLADLFLHLQVRLTSDYAWSKWCTPVQ